MKIQHLTAVVKSFGQIFIWETPQRSAPRKLGTSSPGLYTNKLFKAVGCNKHSIIILNCREGLKEHLEGGAVWRSW